jgi:hypothetical protein
MARGGYRPGSGPAKGTKYRPRVGKEPKPQGNRSPQGELKAPRKPRAEQKPKPPPEPTDADKIRQMLAMGTKVRARMYQEFLQRVGRGEKLTLAEKRMMEKIGDELTAELNGEKPPTEVTATGAPETPLEFMLRIMNDPTQPEDYRARMAVSAAPFIHPRKGEGAGKKEEKSDRAKAAGSGKFAASAPPKLKVVGKP